MTGGTGLIGSNICEQLRARGDRVRALARPGSEVGPLRALGVEIVEGDVSDAASVLRAARGCDAAIHSAAVLGGVSQDPNEHFRVNTGGVNNVLDAAQKHGMRKVITLGTTTYFDFKTRSLTESSPVDPDASTDPYTQTKRAAYLEAIKILKTEREYSVKALAQFTRVNNVKALQEGYAPPMILKEDAQPQRVAKAFNSYLTAAPETARLALAKSILERYNVSEMVDYQAFVKSGDAFFE